MRSLETQSRLPSASLGPQSQIQGCTGGLRFYSDKVTSPKNASGRRSKLQSHCNPKHSGIFHFLAALALQDFFLLPEGHPSHLGSTLERCLALGKALLLLLCYLVIIALGIPITTVIIPIIAITIITINLYYKC